MRAPLAHCSPEAVAFILARTRRLQEFGAGEGLWSAKLAEAGVEIVAALDPKPRGPNVTVGTHADGIPGVDVLIVWPPDCTHIWDWVGHLDAPTVFVVGQSRFTTGLEDAYDKSAPIMLGGLKGLCRMVAWTRR